MRRPHVKLAHCVPVNFSRIMDLFDKKSLFIITGAARGYGKAVALAIASHLSKGALQGKGSTIVCTSRSEERLQSLTGEISAIGPEIQVKLTCMELDNVEAMPDVFSACLDVEVSAFDVAVLVHNAGDAGDFTLSCKQFSDAGSLQKVFALNVTSMVSLTGAYLRRFEDSNVKLYVVHISSLLGIEAFPGFHQYCMTKAARDMYVKVLAKEQPSVRCLNWAPGPMPTDLFHQLCKGAHSADVRESFSKMSEEKTYVTCEDSSAKLMSLLANDKFESGVHLDYYDV